VGRWDIR